MKPEDFKPHGFLCIANAGGIELMIDERECRVYYRFNYALGDLQDMDKEEILSAEIQDDQEGEHYFMHQYPKAERPQIFYLNEFSKAH